MQDIRAYGQPSLRSRTDTPGLMLYPVVVEANLSTAEFTRVYASSSVAACCPV